MKTKHLNLLAGLLTFTAIDDSAKVRYVNVNTRSHLLRGAKQQPFSQARLRPGAGRHCRTARGHGFHGHECHWSGSIFLPNRSSVISQGASGRDALIAHVRGEGVLIESLNNVT